MGRNSQKRRTRKVRSLLSGEGDAQPATAEGELASERRRGPLWLRPSLEVAAAVSTDPALADEHERLRLACLVARGAPFDQIAQSAATLTTSDAALLALVDETAASFEASLQVLGGFRHSRPTGESGLRELLTPALVGDALGTRAPILLRDAPRDPRMARMATGQRTGSLLVMGLFEPGAPRGFGLLVLGRREVGAFFDRDVATCEQLGPELGLDLKQAAALRHALTDPLTGFYSRQAMLLQLDRELEQAHRRGRDLCAVVIALDVDAPRSDVIEDQQLQKLAASLSEVSRGAEFVGRLFGRELLLVLEADLHDAEIAAARILEDLEGEAERSSERPTLSVGIAELGHLENAPSLLSRTRGALQAARAAGGRGIGLAAPLSPTTDEAGADSPHPGDEPG